MLTSLSYSTICLRREQFCKSLQRGHFTLFFSNSSFFRTCTHTSFAHCKLKAEETQNKRTKQSKWWRLKMALRTLRTTLKLFVELDLINNYWNIRRQLSCLSHTCTLRARNLIPDLIIVELTGKIETHTNLAALCFNATFSERLFTQTLQYKLLWMRCFYACIVWGSSYSWFCCLWLALHWKCKINGKIQHWSFDTMRQKKVAKAFLPRSTLYMKIWRPTNKRANDL